MPVRRIDDGGARAHRPRQRTHANAVGRLQVCRLHRAGRGDGTWIGVNPNHVEINAAEEFDDPGSVYSFYKKLIAMRHNNATIATGEWNLVAADSEQVYSFTRTSGDDTILVIVNLTDRTAQVPAEVAQLLEDGVGESQVLLSTYDAVHSVSRSLAASSLAGRGS